MRVAIDQRLNLEAIRRISDAKLIQLVDEAARKGGLKATPKDDDTFLNDEKGCLFLLTAKPVPPRLYQSHHVFNSGDNLTVAPNGHLIVCEDQYTDIVDNYLRGLTPAGLPYDMARLRLQTELAWACFSPDGRVLFVNVFAPTRTLAINGP